MTAQEKYTDRAIHINHARAADHTSMRPHDQRVLYDLDPERPVVQSYPRGFGPYRYTHSAMNSSNHPTKQFRQSQRGS